MSESNATELIKYLTEDNLKLMYGRLNRRYVVVDALPSVDSLEPADKNVIYVVKETVGKAVRYWPNVLDNDAWKPFGIDQEDLDRKADKVSDATVGNFAGLDANGNLTDSGFKASDFKPKQTAVTDPTASGSGIEFIDSISQDTNGVIVPAKKSVQVAVASTSGVGGNAGVMSAADKEKLDGIEDGAQANTIEKVKAAGIDLDIVGKVANIPAMTGATAQGAGASGLVPAPTAGDQAKFLKGDGTWAAPPEANLANYYYDDRGNGLSAKRTGYDSPYGTTSLVGGQGNMNDYTIDATFWIDWGGIARNFFSVNTSVPGASRIGFGINSTDASAMRYLLPTPVANKYAKTDANGQITWGDVPALPSPTINDSLLLGQADGSETWTALENDVFGTRLPDEETGEPMYDASSTDQLWTGFAGKKFGAARAVADQDGNVFGETYARKLLPATKAFAASVTVDNNRVTSITGVTGSVAIDITVAPGECANTAVELTTGSSVAADSAVTVTVNGVAAGRAAATDGKISASKKYQVTCVGTCWTMAEFETANA